MPCKPLYRYTVLPRNKLTLRFGRVSCGLRSRLVRFAVAARTVCGRGSYGLRSRFVRFAAAVRSICGRGWCGLRSRCVQFAVAVFAFFSPTAENHGVVFRRFPTTTVIIRFLITRFIFQYCVIYVGLHYVLCKTWGTGTRDMNFTVMYKVIYHHYHKQNYCNVILNSTGKNMIVNVLLSNNYVLMSNNVLL